MSADESPASATGRQNAAKLQGKLAATLTATRLLAATSAAERQQIGSEATAELRDIAASSRGEDEKKAWVAAYQETFDRLTAAIEDETEADRQTREMFSVDRLWSYIDDETGREHPAILDSLIKFAEVGFFQNGSLVKRPLSDQWLDARQVEELAPGFAAWKQATTWKVNLNGSVYEAQGVNELAQWVTEGRVGPETQVFNPHEGKWMPARDVSKLAPVWNARRQSGCLTGLLSLFTP